MAVSRWLLQIHRALLWPYWLLSTAFFILRWIWRSSLWRSLSFCYYLLSQNPLWYPLQIKEVLQGEQRTPLRRNLERVFSIAATNFVIALLFAFVQKVTLIGADLNWCALLFTGFQLIDLIRSIYAGVLYMLYAKILHHDAVSIPNFVQDASLRSSSYASLRDSPAILCVLREISSAMFYLTGSLVAYCIGVHISRAASFVFGAYLIGHATVDYKLSHAMISTQGTMDVAESQHLYYLGLGLPIKAVALFESMLWNHCFGVNESFLEGPLILLLLVVIHAHDLPLVDEYPFLFLRLERKMPLAPIEDGVYCEYQGVEQDTEDGILVSQDVFNIQLAHRGKWLTKDFIPFVEDVGFVPQTTGKIVTISSASLVLQLPEEDHSPIWLWIKRCQQSQSQSQSSPASQLTAASSVTAETSASETRSSSPIAYEPPAPRLIIHKRDAEGAKRINEAMVRLFNFAGVKYHRAPRMPVSISPRLQRLAHWLLRRTFEMMITLIKSAAAPHEVEQPIGNETAQDQPQQEQHFPLMQWLEAFPYTWYGSTLKFIFLHFLQLDCGQQLVQQRSKDLKLLYEMLTEWRREIMQLLQALKMTAQAEQFLNNVGNVVTTFYLTFAETGLTEMSTTVRTNVSDQIASYLGLSKTTVDTVLVNVIKLSPFHSILHQAKMSADSFQSLFFLSPGEACQLISAAAKISYKLELDKVIETLIPSVEEAHTTATAAGEPKRAVDKVSTNSSGVKGVGCGDNSDTGSSSLDVLSTVATADDTQSDESHFSSVLSTTLVESTVQVSKIVNSASIRLRTWSSGWYSDAR